MKFLKGVYKNITTGQQLVLLVLLILIFCSISLFVAYLFQDQFASLEHTPLWFLLLRQTSDSLALFIIPCFVLLYSMGLSVGKWLMGSQKIDVALLGWIALLMMALIPLVHFLGGLNAAIPFPESWTPAIEIEEQIAAVLERFFETDSLMLLLWVFVVIAVIPALGEEFLFRGFLLRWLLKGNWPGTVSILLSGFIFSVLHMQLLGLIPRFLLGVLLAWLFYRSGSLIYAVWGHFVYNGSLFFVHVYDARYTLSEQQSASLEGGNTTVLLISSLFAMAAFFALLTRLRQKNTLPLVEAEGLGFSHSKQ